jgi:hypothetical protein
MRAEPSDTRHPDPQVAVHRHCLGRTTQMMYFAIIVGLAVGIAIALAEHHRRPRLDDVREQLPELLRRAS